jgi:hypothetical protein
VSVIQIYITNRFSEYYYDYQMKEIRVGGNCSGYGEVRNAYKILVVKPEERRTLRITGC